LLDWPSSRPRITAPSCIHTLHSLPKLHAWRCIHLRLMEHWNLGQSQNNPFRNCKITWSIFGAQENPRCLD
jgi:hypothetical protein